ncbi:MAG: NusA N-terminal domain-containing protein [Myxococcota bacterium]
MTEVAIVAYRTDRDIRGVYLHDAPEPWSFGNLLLLEVLDQSGDLSAVVQTAIDEVPQGWQSFARREVRPARSGAAFVTLEALDVAPVAWLYVLDIDERRLDAWASPASRDLGPPSYSTTFAADGRATPFETPRPQAPLGRVLPAWDGDQGQDRQLRQRIARELPAPQHDVTRAWFEDELEDLLSELDWQIFVPSSEELRYRERLSIGPPDALSLWSSSSTFWVIRPGERAIRKYWQLRIGPYAVNYPASSERADEDDGSDVVLLRADGAMAECPPLASVFLLGQDDISVRFADAVTRALAGTEARFEYHSPQIFVLKKVVKKVQAPDTEITLEDGRAFDPDCSVGDVLGWNVPPYGGYWTLFDWLRMAA